MFEKYCRLEGKLQSWEAEELKNVFEVFFLKGGELFNELNFEGNKRFIPGTAAETQNAAVSVKTT